MTQDFRPGPTMAARSVTIDRATYDEGLRKFMLRVYNYMFVAMMVSFGTAFAIANVPALQQLFFAVNEAGSVTGYSGIGLVAVFGTLGLLWFSPAIMRGRSVVAAQGIFWLLAAGIGVSVAATLILYTGASVARVFLITAATFAGVSLYGYTTKRRLDGIAQIAGVGVIVLLVASLINFIIGSPLMVMAISGIGVVLAVVMIAANTQMIKEVYAHSLTEEEQDHAAIFGALGLFVWFINLFQFLMIFLGNRE